MWNRQCHRLYIDRIPSYISLAEIDPTGIQYMHVYRITKASTLEYKYNMHLHSDMHALMPITFVSNDDRHLAIVPHSYVT